ncbi:guanine nucleotide-binding protein subunit gamma 2-like [Quillaja saponaria]|uniref:Guanine nucleotide-binding protein subunit gamma 2-like n=1 Tax=Quillaja saponaria TaxID=32244 RepID=A0AAD7PKZ1_QUISA|nr:guanine nucleotide-binding protein subunit gamma 2-like [Quillaja saponaria]
MDEQEESQPSAATEGIDGRVAEHQIREEGEQDVNGQTQARIESSPNFIGRHRMAAAMSHLHNQINIIQEELDLLETYGESSLVCKEVILSVESIPDPLLTESSGNQLGSVVQSNKQLTKQ